MTTSDRAEHPSADAVQLRVPDGPWNADVWLIPRSQRYAASGEMSCAVTTCDHPAGRVEGDPVKDTDVLCVPHRRRFRKAKDSHSVSEFAIQQATCGPILRPRGKVIRKPYCDPIDFTRVSPILADELRYVTAVKTARMMWHDADYVASVLRGAINLAVKHRITRLRDFPLPPAGVTSTAACLDAMFPGETSSAGARSFAGVIRNLRKLIDEATSDPWEADVWHAADLDLPGRNQLVPVAKIYWSRVTCRWLRMGLKSLARQQLQSGSRSWSTIRAYARGGSLFSRYLDDEVGHIEPQDITRGTYLDFVAWVRDEDSAPTDLRAVNTLARLLTDLRVMDIVPELPGSALLLRGENAIPTTRKPKPFPADILEAIDSLINDESALPRIERLMLRLFRAIGPRASEALTLPRDSVAYVDGRGYSLEYFQSKVQEWRRVPLPPNLGRDLVAQAQWVTATYGPHCKWMFPYAGPRPRQNTVAHADTLAPWPFNRFRTFVWKVYQDHGIVRSALTGETLTGAQLHRFRHSIATGLLNEGWSQYEVQTFLGHKSPTMMQAYAEINDDKLREKYLEFVNSSVDINGANETLSDRACVDVERLRDRMMRSTLPNGFCTLPEKQSCDFLPSPCLSCTFFRTTPSFLPIHIRQRDEAVRELDIARVGGRQRAADAHEKTIARLDKIINGLEQIADNGKDISSANS